MVTERRCGYCGTDFSKRIIHGKVRQNVWYRNQDFGWICVNCNSRLQKTGSIVKRSDAQNIIKCKLMREANMALYDAGWECASIEVIFHRGTLTPWVKAYVFRCKHCGREIHWGKSLDEFIASKNSTCDCIAFRWVFDNNLFRKNSKRQQDVAIDIYNNPQLSYSEIANRNRISRQRIEQIRRGIRTRYFIAKQKEGENNGQT